MKTPNLIPGYWYSTSAGLLIQVRVVLYTKGIATHVVTEDIRGERFTLTVDEWQECDVLLHSPVDIADTPSVDLWQR